MTKAILFYRNSLLTKLFMLVILLVGGGNSAWADKVLFSTNFSTADGWSTEDIITSSTTSAKRTIKGTEISFKGYSSQNVSVAAESSSGTLTFTRAFLSSSAGTITDSNPNYYMAIPVTGVVGGSVTINYTAPTKFSMYYTYDDGNTGTVVARSSTVSGTNVSFTISGLTNDEVTIYLGAYGYSITSLSITTYDKIDPSSSSFYPLYKETSSYTSAATLIAEASLPSYIAINNSSQESSSSNSSSITTPHDFAGLSSNSYYRLMPRSSSSIVIGSISHVKSIRLYGNGTGGSGNIVVNAVKLLGDGSDFSVDPIAFSNSQKTVVEYSTGNLTDFAGKYDADTYYIYTITFTNNFSLWGLYIEVPDNFTVTYDANGGSGTISDGTGASIDLSNGSGFTAPKGYTFAGWNTDPHGEGTSYASGQTGVKANLDLYAVWTQSGTIDDNGGTADGAYIATYNKAGIEITTAPTNSSYAIKGYYEADTGDDLVATSAGALEASTTYTDASGYWTHTGSAPTLYAQWENTHTLTVNMNDAGMGSVEADETTIAEGSTTNVTATANSGYKFRSWAVSGTGASLSSTTDNPTSFTMGTDDATVTANFSALETYTISYAAGSAGGVTGSKADESKKEDVAFTLPSSAVFTRSGYVQTGWATEDGGDQAYELGGSYTTNAAQTFYPSWTEQYTLTYDANGGTGSMSAYEGLGSITLAANTYTKTGYTFIGWATSQANADAKTVAYTDKAAYTLSADATLYAVWAENYSEMKPATSGTAPTAGSDIDMQSGTFGGTMTVESSAATLNYTSNGLSSFSGQTTLDIVLNDYMKPGTVISVTLYGSTAGSRGFDLYTSDGEDKITTFAHTSAGYATYQYTVTSDDGLDGTNSFRLTKETHTAMIYLTSLTVTDCQPGGVISASGWNTYSSNKKLDLSTISDGTAYVASSTGGGKVKLTATDGIVAAGTGLMIKGEPGDKFTINTSSSAATLSETNLLVGLPNGGTVTAEAYNYVFGWTDAANPGFYYVNSTEPVLGAGKAYLHVDGGTGARLSINFGDDTPTSINSIDNSQEHNINAYYDLQGRKVKNPTKGLYISNGKKVFVGNKH